MYVYIYKCMYMSICILQGFYTSQSDGHVDHNQNMFVFEPCHCKLTHDLCLQKASQLVRFALLNSNKTKNPVKHTRFDHAPKTRANFYQPDAFKKKKKQWSVWCETKKPSKSVAFEEVKFGFVMSQISMFAQWSFLFCSYPIVSMYAIYGNMDPINIPQMLAYIPAPWILWVWWSLW